MDDVRAGVMEAALPSRQAVLFGLLRGLRRCAILFAASYPERTRALILLRRHAKAAGMSDDDYPWAPTRETRGRLRGQPRARLGLRVPT